MDKAIGKLDLILSKLLCRTENNSKELKRHTDQLRYHESEIERLKKRKHHNEQKETFLQFAEKKGTNLSTLKYEIQYVLFGFCHH